MHGLRLPRLPYKIKYHWLPRHTPIDLAHPFWSCTRDRLWRHCITCALLGRAHTLSLYFAGAQTDLPAITAYDAKAIQELAAEFEIDYVALTYTCDDSDVVGLLIILPSLVMTDGVMRQCA